MRSLRELDESLGQPKGTAFRAFKALLPELEEGRDFRHLEAGRDGAELQALRQAQRIYRNSVNTVLLEDEAARQVLARMRRD